MQAPSRAEICIIAVAELFRNAGEVMVSPFGTVPAIAARLARLSFAPDLVLTDGEAALMASNLAVNAKPSELQREASMTYRSVFSVVWSGRRNMVMMASQIDRFGNQNLTAIGDHQRPSAQLVGVRGAPGNTANHPTSYWIPKHSVGVFVEQVDAVCGIGNDRAAQSGIAASRYHHLGGVVTNLAVLDFSGPQGSMALRSVHPGVSVDEVIAASGFELHLPADIPESSLPTDVELTMIRESLDPKALRDREVST